MGNNESIGGKILALRKAKGITQAELGAYLNISYQAVSKWERDESCPDFATMSKLAKYFNVALSYFEETAISEVAEAKETLVETVEVEMLICPFCGKPTAIGNAFCDNCDGYIGNKAKDCEKTIINKDKVIEEKVEESSKQDSVKEMIGVCKDCGKIVYRGEEGLLEPALVCKKCCVKRETERKRKAAEEKRKLEEQRKQELLKKQIEEGRIKRNFLKGLITGAILGGALFTLGIILAIAVEWSYLLIFLGVGVVGFTFFSQIVWDGIVADCAFAGGARIGTPGVIFTFDVDGFTFLLAMKILFAVLRFIVYVVTLLACLAAAVVISPFTFFPACLRVKAGREAY